MLLRIFFPTKYMNFAEQASPSWSVDAIPMILLLKKNSSVDITDMCFLKQIQLNNIRILVQTLCIFVQLQ